MEEQKVKHKHYQMGEGTTYKYVGFWFPPSEETKKMFSDIVDEMNKIKPAVCKGACDHCGKKIVYHHIIEDTNGESFCVGSECIKKLNDVELADVAEKTESEIKQKYVEKERELLNELERKQNNGFTNKEMRKIKMDENKDILLSERQKIAQPILEMMKYCSMRGDRKKVLWEYRDSSTIKSYLQDPKRELTEQIKNGILYQLDFLYNKSHMANSAKNGKTTEECLQEFEVEFEKMKVENEKLKDKKKELDDKVKKEYKDLKSTFKK